jgi:pimeloyl-ACP methyl ester carboxylesterase
MLGRMSDAPPSRSVRLLRRLIPWTCLYGVWLVACFGCNLTDRLLLFPRTEPIGERLATQTTLAWGRESLDVWVARSRRSSSAEPELFVLEFVGNATRAEETVAVTAALFDDFDAEVWTVNYPGYGASTGEPRLIHVARSAAFAFEQLRRRAGDRPIVVYGTSIGTTAALHLADRPGVSAMLLVNPPPLRSIILRQHGWWNLWLLAGPVAMGVPRELDNLGNARRAIPPAVFVTSGRDEVVTYRFQRMVVDAYAGTKQELHFTDNRHNTPWTGDQERQVRKAVGHLLRTSGLDESGR